jgi:hypothetical protein
MPPKKKTSDDAEVPESQEGQADEVVSGKCPTCGRDKVNS